MTRGKAWGETVWAWLGGKWVRAHARLAGNFGVEFLKPLHVVRTADGKVRRSYCVQYRDPSRGGRDKPEHAVQERGEAVWVWLKGRGWTKARMYATAWGGGNASVYTGKTRGNSCYLVPRFYGVRPRDPALSGRDKPSNMLLPSEVLM